jgi:hypothetical protein
MTIGISSTLLLASLASAQPSALGCTTGEQAAAELRIAHETDRRAHLEGKAELMAPGMADESSNSEGQPTPQLDFCHEKRRLTVLTTSPSTIRTIPHAFGSQPEP